MKQLIPIILFGAIWGLIEATLGGVLHLVRIPFTGTIMASFGFAVLFAALRSGLRPAQLLSVSLVAASFKFLDAPLFHLALVDRTIINPALAIASQGLVFAFIAHRWPMNDRIATLAPRMLAAAAGGLVLFNGISWSLGWSTHQIAAPWNTALVQLPLMTIGATGLAWLTRPIESHLSSWSRLQQTGAAMACIALILISRAIL